MRKRAAPATDVIDAMQLAERVFSTYEGNQKLLVVFSDMIEESRRYNFTTEKLTAARIGQIIANEQDAGRLPDLQGVEVCVVGAGATTSGGLPADKLLTIREFWIQYFKARSEEHTSELQSPYDLVCRLLLEKKNKNTH